jgi:hypothetical protein
MVVGFNHNIVYKGEVFHVQTEDSGIKNPHIVTLLYRGGVILCSKKTRYADILMMDKLESVVEELMKDQHKDMLRRLKSGEFDERAFSIEARVPENCEIPSPGPEAEAAPAPEPAPKPQRMDDIPPSPGGSSRSDLSMRFEMPVQKAAPATPAAPQPAEKPAKDVVALDCHSQPLRRQ